MRLNEQISERIKQSRKRLGFSQDVLGAKVGVSRVSISQWERGENTPNGRFLNDLAAALGVSVNWLLTGDDSTTEPGSIGILGSWGSGKTGNVAALTKRLLEGMDAEQRAAFLSAAVSDLKSKNIIIHDEAHRAGGVKEEQAGFSNVEPAVIPQGRRVPILSYVQAGNWREICEQATAFDGNVEYVSAGVDIGPCGFGLWVRGDSMSPEFKEGDLIVIDPDEAPRPGDYVVASNGSNEATFKKYRARGEYENGQPRFELVPLNEDHETLSTDQTPIIIIGVMVEHRSYRKRGG